MGRRTPPDFDKVRVDLTGLPLLHNGDSFTIKEDTMPTNPVPPPRPRIRVNDARNVISRNTIRPARSSGLVASGFAAWAAANDPQPHWWQRRARREWRNRWGLTP